MFSTLTERVQTGGWAGLAVGIQKGPAPRGPGRSDVRASDHADSVGLLPPVALRDLELHPLALFKRAVPVRLNC